MNLTLEALEKAIQAKGETPPKGFKTSAQWATEWGIATGTASRKLSAGVLAGAVEVVNVPTHNGRRVLPIPHYGPKK